MSWLDTIKQKLGNNGKPQPAIGAVMIPKPGDKFSTHPGENLNPEELARIFREAEQGNVRRQMELFEEFEEKDTHLFSQLQTRKNAVAGLEWSILPASDSEEDKKTAELIGDILYNLEDMDDLMLDLLDSIGKGYSVAEIMWGYHKGLVVPKEIPWREPKKFKFNDLDEMRIISDEDPANGIRFPENKFIVHKYKAKSGSPTRAGVLRVCAWMYLFKNYSVKDWLAFSEVYGMPIRIGKYAPGTSQADKEALMQALINIGADGAGVISTETMIEFIESQRSEGLLYDRLIKLCNAEMSKAILGQTLTSEVGDSGSRALGDTHNLVRYDLLKADCRALEKTLRRDLIRPLVEFNVGPNAAIPKLKLDYERPEDLVQEAAKYEALIVRIGLPVAEEHIYEKFSVPMPEQGQKLLIPPSTASGGAFPFTQQIAAKEKPAKSEQVEVDRLADQGVIKGVEGIEKTLNPLLTIIHNAKSFTEIRRNLIDSYQDLPPNELEELLQKALYIADLRGRSEVMEDGE